MKIGIVDGLVDILLLFGLIILFWIIGYYMGQRDAKKALEIARQEGREQVFKELDKYQKDATLYLNYGAVKDKFLQERMK